jgi:tripartite-type tricarboxylate transporter receptor subunit TctC
MKRFVACAAAAGCLGAVHAASAAAPAAYPDTPIRVIVPFTPGGGTDILARTVANKLSEGLGWQFVFDNRPGAGGVIGVDLAAKAAPDGYTMVIGQTSNLAINPNLYAKPPYKGVEATTWFGYLVPAKTLPQIVARLSAETAKVLSQPAMRERMTSAVEAVPSGAEAFAAVIKADLAKWGKIVRDAGLKVE